jgi:positive regulator of sigma E activity
MDTRREVTHTGIINKIDNKGIKVTIGVLAGCSDCQIKGNCNMAEQSVKELFIECDSAKYKTGQRVIVRLKSKREINFQFLKYILPFFILIMVMLITSVFTRNETTIGIISVITLISYYIFYMLTGRRSKKGVQYEVNPLLE